MVANIMDATDIIFCTNCRNNIPKASWTLHSISCERHRWYCKSCKEAFPKSEREKHEQEFHAVVYCECGEDIEVRKLDLHKKNDCAIRLVPCMYCECPLRFHELSEHEVACGSRTEPCELCNKRVQLRHISVHVCKDENSCVPTSPPVPEQPRSNIEELIICPFCMSPFQDYMMLQEHIFHEHPEIVE